MPEIQYLQDVLNTKSMEELWRLHCEKMETFGFNRLFYGFTRYRTPNSLGDPADFLVLTNYPAEYAETYVGTGLYAKAPMTRWALENEGAASWRHFHEMLASGDVAPEVMEVIRFNLSWNVVAGYTVSFKSLSYRTKSAIALCAREGLTQSEVEAIWAEHGQSLVVMNNVMHLKLQSLPQYNPGRHLTGRQREVLEWVGDGKTTQDIATIMELTPPTVEKHLRAARDNLNVETTAQAVLKLALLNQMFVVDL